MLCLVFLVFGCGGSPGRSNQRSNQAIGGIEAISPDDPLPVEANRNAPPPVLLEGEVVFVLWCSQPTGPACTAAQLELGALPTPTEAVPPELLGPARDETDDCADPDLVPTMQRVTAAVGASTRGWTDQEGALEAAANVPDLYAGSGCTNAASLGDPPVKIHVVDGQRLLIRIWEAGEDH